MKKILFLLLLAITSLTTYAQKTYSIERPLQLENVAKGIKKDSVLVRGSDKVIRFVPRSEFGGSSQNLKQTLDNGNTAIDLDDNSLTINPIGLQLDNSATQTTKWQAEGISFNNDGSNSLFSGTELQITSSDNATSITKDQIRNKGISFASNLILNLERNLIGDNTFKFPENADGYSGILATRDDITLQRAVDNSGGLVNTTELNFTTSFGMFVNGWFQVEGLAQVRDGLNITNGGLTVNNGSILTGGNALQGTTTINGFNAVTSVNGNYASESGNVIVNLLKNYKVYTALISQTGTDAPVYHGTLAGAFIEGKSTMNTSVSMSGSLVASGTMLNVAAISTKDADTLASADGKLANSMVEIRVYPN
jgi:hypothetical protein